LWSWLSYDFDTRISLDEILLNAEKKIQCGDILVLHDNYKFAVRQKELLPRLVSIIQNKGLHFGEIQDITEFDV
jgi:hypothetical protein